MSNVDADERGQFEKVGTPARPKPDDRRAARWSLLPRRRAAEPKRPARPTPDAGHTRRLLTLAVIYNGRSRVAAAEPGDIERRIVQFNAEGPAGSSAASRRAIPRSSTTRSCRARADCRARAHPSDGRRGGWRPIDLAAWAWDPFGISVSEATLSRELEALGSSNPLARPRRHTQNEERIRYGSLWRIHGVDEGSGEQPLKCRNLPCMTRSRHSCEATLLGWMR